MLTGVDDAHKISIAHQTSDGAVSAFIERKMIKNSNHNWGQMKAQLAVRFSNITDGQMALSLLRQYKHKVGESIHNYAERILFVFVALRPMSTAMVIAGRSVHLTTLFPGQV